MLASLHRPKHEAVGKLGNVDDLEPLHAVFLFEDMVGGKGFGNGYYEAFASRSLQWVSIRFSAVAYFHTAIIRNCCLFVKVFILFFRNCVPIIDILQITE